MQGSYSGLYVLDPKGKTCIQAIDEKVNHVTLCA